MTRYLHRPYPPRDDRPLRIALLLGAVLGVLLGGLTAPFGIVAR